jgi:hypothetical protein
VQVIKEMGVGFADHQVPVECFVIQSLLEAVVVGVDVGVANENVPILRRKANENFARIFFNYSQRTKLLESARLINSKSDSFRFL